MVVFDGNRKHYDLIVFHRVMTRKERGHLRLSYSLLQNPVKSYCDHLGD